LGVVGELYQVVDGRRKRGGVAGVHRGYVIRGTTVGRSDTRAERGWRGVNLQLKEGRNKQTSSSTVHDRGPRR
jgi:hypothetical protein